MLDDLPCPHDLHGAQAFDCLRRLRVASQEILALVEGDDELQAEVERVLRDAWWGIGRFRDS